MEKAKDCLEKIQELKKAKFDYHLVNICFQQVFSTSLLRTALLVCNTIGYIEDKEKRSDLCKMLDTSMKEKFKQINPNLSEKLLNEMVSYYHRGIYQYPIDLFVIGDAVFSKEVGIDDFGSPYKIKTFMYDNNGTYFNIFDTITFQQVEDIFEFNKNGNIRMSKEQEIKLTTFICDNINATLKAKFECLVTRPIYELNTEQQFYGYKGITHNEVAHISIFLNKKYRDIARSIIKKEECDIEMLLQQGDNISMYNFHQNFIGDDPIWEATLVEEPVWKLSEAAIAYENNMRAPKRKLEDKK